MQVTLAANRGEKGFSNVIAEALQLYLEAENRRTGAIQRALALRGRCERRTLRAYRLERQKIRANWR